MKKKRNPKQEAIDRMADYFASRSGDADDIRSLAEAMEGEPTITPALREIGLDVVLKALRTYEDEDAQSFLEVYDSRSARDRLLISWEMMAVVAGIGSARLFEVCCSAVRNYGMSVSQMVLSVAMPKIVRRSIKSALTAKGVDDRMAMLKAGAILPVPKGSQIAIQLNAQQSKEALPEPTAWDQEQQLRSLHEAWTPKKQLPAHQPSTLLPDSVNEIQAAAAHALEEV